MRMGVRTHDLGLTGPQLDPTELTPPEDVGATMSIKSMPKWNDNCNDCDVKTDYNSVWNKVPKKRTE